MALFSRKTVLSADDRMISQFCDLTRNVLGKSISGFLSNAANLPQDSFGIGPVKVVAVERDMNGAVQAFSLVAPLQRKRGFLSRLVHGAQNEKIADLTVCRDISRKLCSTYLASSRMFGIKPSPALDYAATPDCASVRVPTDSLRSETDVLTCVADKQTFEIGRKLLAVKGYDACRPRAENIQKAVLGL